MTNLYDYITEWIDEQTTTKLSTTKQLQYDKIKKIIFEETQEHKWQSHLVHIFLDNVWDAKIDPNTKLTWTSQVWQFGKTNKVN